MTERQFHAELRAAVDRYARRIARIRLILEGKEKGKLVRVPATKVKGYKRRAYSYIR